MFRNNDTSIDFKMKSALKRASQNRCFFLIDTFIAVEKRCRQECNLSDNAGPEVGFYPHAYSPRLGGGRGRFQALPQSSPQKTFLAGLARAAGRGRRRRAPGVPLSRAAARTSRRACLFKFQLRGRETAPPGAQAGRRRLARAPAPAPGCAPRRARSARGLLGGGGAGRGGAARPRSEERASRAGRGAAPGPAPALGGPGGSLRG
uniref:Uncharacterized protein n=1 Tax=Rangifer tarandus platyrhynchus TaxID=3082113 RepID=A0ACB0ES84_RANTA|nr:unnamed protein product [Rangifer tarandus platyrhynchus]